MQRTFTIFLLVLSLKLSAQVPSLSSSEIFQNIKKLNVLGSVLYIAAHPDDENTLMLSYLSKDQLVRTGYLSLTRGDGGQNLIGAEQGYNIGVIRTQELLGARKIDGAQQFFSRAYDFGFSKTREETLTFWDKDKILGDVVWMIRKFRPDVIITRFPPDPRAGHGHHQTSAYLAEEGFALAADPKSYPDQLKFVKPWQAKRLVWNSYTPNFTNDTPTEEKSSYISIEIGGYNSILGKSYTEIAAESRSQHKSQGFGSSPQRGKRTDYFLHKVGQKAEKGLFDGVDISWKRIKGSEKTQALISQTIKSFSVSNPSASIPDLLKVHAELLRLDSANMYMKAKKEEVQDLILQCAGLWFETNPDDYSAVAGDKTSIRVSITKRSNFPVKLLSMRYTGIASDTTLNLNLDPNNLYTYPINTTLPADLKISQPYWLEKPLDKGIFQIDNQQDIGFPENRPGTKTMFRFEIGGQTFTVSRPWIYKFADPAEGEIYRPFEIRPAITATITEPVYIFPTMEPKNVTMLVQAQRQNVKGSIRPQLAAGWKSVPESAEFQFTNKYQQQYFTFAITPPTGNQEVTLKAIATVEGKTFDKSIKTIAYHHIPSQTIFPTAEARLAKVDVKVTAKNIGYIAGAGDDVPTALRQMDCQVTMLNEAGLSKDLAGYDAIVVGVRAYNTEGYLANYQEKLMDYVKNGGTMIVQYTIPGQKVKQIGPFNIELGRDRITEEDAEMRPLIPESPLLNYPNKITEKDFQGWIQERGLYFASNWDKKNYQALFSGNDKGESPKEGSVLYAQYGKGHYIYTGLSFFRELPAGVTGAYRLFANMISVGKK
ncbi:PIG-L family deacetylase [Dyadobacter sp. CY323]|uniref:PIG-L family deacetylase n=1 Tax=Dyadobacter sp. CY323 TaxID=2907302 RepID=UPI001F1B954A|nr:PIG-L family deacetylase [Dyadobacter sp. CY323]MCE6992544.1 PIG-L family deacetylase [Dyadobacter sp. CY323]